MKSTSLLFFCMILLLKNIALAESPPEISSQKMLCTDLVEDFCKTLWKAPNFGNMDVNAGKVTWSLRYGTTDNEIEYTRLIFLKALKKHIRDLPVDIHKAFERTQFEKKLDTYLGRKRPDQLKPSDLSRPEYLNDLLVDLDRTMNLVAIERTDKLFSGYSRLPHRKRSTEMYRTHLKHLDVAWSELFIAVWTKEVQWKEVQTLFTQIREEYMNLIQGDKSMSATLKSELLSNLLSVKLVIPGENPAHANSTEWHHCGIDMENAVYRPNYNELTVCAGRFNGGSSLLTLSHEIGHSISIGRRVQTYLNNSDYGKSMLKLWERVAQGQHYSCDEWSKFKTDLAKQAKDLPDYKFEDAKRLETFISKKLKPTPTGVELQKLADRSGKKTMRTAINNRYLEKIVKEEEILPDGSRVKNYRYLNPTINDIRWPLAMSALSGAGLQFELFFSEEYSCQKEKKSSDIESLKKGVEEALTMVSGNWGMWLRVPGKFSDFQVALDEEFAENIEEDLVDATSSLVIARLLQKISPLQERRNAYLASMASYCEPPSFIEQYQDEAYLLKSFSNLAHSMGQDRRRKLLTPEVREALECK